jgi:glycosyltransferase involved in cell wall biosynthesis
MPGIEQARSDHDPRPLLVLINNVQTPYRVHLHRRIVRELSDVRIASIYTHDQPDQPWQAQRVDEINPVHVGRGQPMVEQTVLRWIIHDWNMAGRIIQWLKEHRARAVILCGYGDPTCLRLIHWCRRAGVPCFVQGDSNIHGDFASGLKRAVKTQLVRWVVRNAVGLMPCGTCGQMFFERYGAKPGRCFFVPYEPDYELIQTLPESAVAEARTAFGLGPARRRVVVCARLVRAKRVDLAIKAFAAIAEERPEWDLVIIGDGVLRDELKARVPAALQCRVIWTGFIGDQARISAIYRASDVLVCPSDLEPWAVVINEAAAAGLAIVASSVVGAAAELVKDGINGRLFPAGNLTALTECLRSVTSAGAISRLKKGSSDVLADWQRRGDPVEGIRQALRFVGVIGAPDRSESLMEPSGASPHTYDGTREHRS